MCKNQVLIFTIICWYVSVLLMTLIEYRNGTDGYEGNMYNVWELLFDCQIFGNAAASCAQPACGRFTHM